MIVKAHCVNLLNRKEFGCNIEYWWPVTIICQSLEKKKSVRNTNPFRFVSDDFSLPHYGSVCNQELRFKGNFWKFYCHLESINIFKKACLINFKWDLREEFGKSMGWKRRGKWTKDSRSSYALLTERMWCSRDGYGLHVNIK